MPALGRRLAGAAWVRILLGGAALWTAAVVVLATTADAHLVPTVVAGCFVVPVTALVGAADRLRPAERSWGLLLRLFLVGGVFGFVAASALEEPLIGSSPAVFAIAVGVLEELVKLGIVVWATRHLPTKRARAGFVYGAAVGLGFAAFESCGYAFAAGSSAAHWASLSSEVLERALITPVTHGLWTAVAGAALFGAADRARFRVRGGLVAAVVAVIALHTLWDLTPDLARGLDLRLLGMREVPLLVTSLPVHLGGPAGTLDTLLEGAGYVLIAAAGLLAARRSLRPARLTSLAGASSGPGWERRPPRGAA